MNSLILSAATRFVSPLMLAYSLFILLRGHNEPGGGFIGGLIAATAFALTAVVQGWLAEQEDTLLVVVVDDDALFHAYGGGGGWEPLDDDDTLGLTNGALVRVYGTARCDDGDPPTYDRFVARRVLYMAPTE